MRLKVKIGTKIFCAFVTMAVMMAGLGFYGIYVLSVAGAVVADTYDRPLMAINFARSASQTFAEMRLEFTRRAMAAADERPAIDQKIVTAKKNFDEDLDVAAQRSLGADERGLIAQIRERVAAWVIRENDAGNDRRPGLDALSAEIASDFDRLVELTADAGFVERRKSIDEIARYEIITMAAAAVALFLAAVIAVLLARRIVQPLATAASVANRIAGGELDTPVPQGGEDETGILLRSMSVMRESIRAMMEREQAQRRSAQSRLFDALESSSEGMVLADSAGKIVIANSQVAAFFPDVAPRLAPGDDFVEAFGEQCAELERGEIKLADGRWIRLNRSITADGGFILFISDFTAVKERERRLKEAQDQAEAASRAKSSFLANMSHELRTPLNAIIGFAEVMAGQMFGQLGSRQYVQYSSDIVGSGRHLLDIINSVLDLAKSESGKLELNPDAVDLGEVLADCARMIREQCARGELTLELAKPTDALTVLGEASKLRQVFLNLLSNAMKFTEPGGTITVATRQAAANWISVTVADTGIGMAEDDVTVAFAPFGQIDSRLARRYEGTGLGLPLAKALVELHGGVLSIESAPGKGTVVTVVLQLAASGDALGAPQLRVAS